MPDPSLSRTPLADIHDEYGPAIDLPNTIGLCPIHGEHFYVPLDRATEDLRCPECPMELVVYARQGKRLTHGRHCSCGACGREDWTNPDLAPCGMHGSDCPALYDPWGVAGAWLKPDGTV